jgi:hypothetical protein
MSINTLWYTRALPRNPQLEARAQRLRWHAEQRWQQTGHPVRLYSDFFYQAQSWPHPRRIAAKCEVSALGVNLRFVVTNRCGTPEQIFDWYDQRGQAENFIKELKNDFVADCIPSSAYRVNTFRLQLHALAYNLLALFRRLVLDRRTRPCPHCAVALTPVQAQCPGAALGPPSVVLSR